MIKRLIRDQVMCTWPRVSMGRPFLEKFAGVQWEVSEEHLQAWKDGKTGYPIVDAAMRACKARGELLVILLEEARGTYCGDRMPLRFEGWMENRVRMVAACFLVKDLMLDWRESSTGMFLRRKAELGRAWGETLHGMLHRWRSGCKQRRVGFEPFQIFEADGLQMAVDRKRVFFAANDLS